MDKEHDTCLCLFPQGCVSSESGLDSAVKRCSSEVLKFSFLRSCSVKDQALRGDIRSEVVGVAKAANITRKRMRDQGLCDRVWLVSRSPTLYQTASPAKRSGKGSGCETRVLVSI